MSNNNNQNNNQNNSDQNFAKLNQHLNEFVGNYYTADCECNAPKMAFWLSSEKRRKCQEAKMNTFLSFTQLCSTVTEVTQSQPIPETITQIVTKPQKSFWD